MNKKRVQAAVAVVVTLIIASSLQILSSASSYSGGGSPEYGRPASAFMTGIRYNDIMSLPSSPNTSIDLPTGWAVTQTSISIKDLVETEDIIINGTFQTGSGQSSPPWSYGEYDPNNTASGSWVNNLPLTGNTCVYAEIPASSGGTTFAKGTTGYWEEQFNVSKGTVTNAILDLWYYADFASNFDRGEFQAYVAVEGHTVWARGFNEISDAGQRNTWVHLTINIYTDTNGGLVFNMPSDQNILVRVGVRYTSGKATYIGLSSNNRVYYDNVSILLTAAVRPEQINLQVNDPNAMNHTVISSDYGEGYTTFYGVFGPSTSPIFDQIIYSYSYNSSNPVSFKNNVTVLVTRQFNVTSVTYSVDNGTDVNWSIRYLTDLSFNNEPKGVGPTFYSKYSFNITLPLDWEVNNITDPNGFNHNVNESNYILYANSSAKTLFINVSSTGLYGLYQVYCSSPNYLKMISLQVFDPQHGWVNSSFFKGGDKIRFIGRVADQNGDPPATLGSSIIYIKDPQGNSWPGATVGVYVNSSSFAVSDNISVSVGSLVGGYLVEFGWSNGYEAGNLKTGLFGVRGQASVTIRHPTGTETYIQSGSSLLIEVELTDPVTGMPINDAIVEYSFSWEPVGTWHNTTRLGNRYISSYTVPESQVGDRTITIRVNHTFYSLTAEASISLQIWQEWYIYFPWGGRILGWLLISYVALAGVVVAGGLSAWNYYFKYPRMVRKIRGMMKAIRKGRVPRVTGVKDRSLIIEDITAKKPSAALSIELGEESFVAGGVPVAVEAGQPSVESNMGSKPPAEEGLKSETVEEKRELTGIVDNGLGAETVKPVLEVDPELQYYYDELNKLEGLTEKEIQQIIVEMKGLSKADRKTMMEVLKDSYSSKPDV